MVDIQRNLERGGPFYFRFTAFVSAFQSSINTRTNLNETLNKTMSYCKVSTIVEATPETI